MGSLFCRFSIRRQIAILAATPLFFAAGCGEAETGLGRIPVTGTVSYGGKTDYDGKVIFMPTSQGPAANTNIVGGRYAFTEADGPIPGTYRVRVQVRDPAADQQTSGVKGVQGRGAGPPSFLPTKKADVTVPEEEPYEINIKV